MLHFKKRIDQQTLPPDITRTAPLCMSHYKRMFNMTRIPKQGCDILHKAHEGDPSSQQITLLVNGHMFLVDVYDTSGDICSLDTLVQRLRACTLEAQCEVTPVAILTADDREIWAKNRDHLASLSPSNGQNLSSVDSSLFCLSLDSTRTRIKHGDSIYSSEDLTNARWDDHLHNTAYGMDGFNRWFDKTITLSVESNTRLGMMGEHSPCDALIPSILGDYCVEEPMHLAEFEPSNFTSESIPGWRRLDWQLDHHITAECQRVAQEAKSIVDDSDDSQLWFQDYGVSWIRGTAKLSPDAFLQMALQLAWLKDQKKPTAIYETASTRIFLHGRTEVIRSFSKESLAFVRAMNDETATASCAPFVSQRN
ncbi:hypothetical protein FRC19_002802 [Serendipita sp. 401]|nr:hypothetical protein FRC19_002802 [Serendipita sp. 401]